MHICTVVPNYVPEFGGAEIGVHMILAYLAKTTDHHFSVITATSDKQLPQYEIIDDVYIHRYRIPNIWAKWFAPVIFAFLHVRPLLKKLNPDIVHISYMLPSGLAAWHWAKSHNHPELLTLGGIDVYDPFNVPPAILKRMMNHAVHNSTLIAAYSGWAKDQLIKQSEVYEHKIRITGFGIDNNKFKPGLDGSIIRERYGINRDTPLIFALQRLEMRKGVDILVKAAVQLQNLNFHMLIGGRGRDEPEINALIRELALEDQVTLCGFVPEEEKQLYYASADIFALHTFHEGLGIVLAEASACAIPIVTTRAGGTTDIVLHNVTGFTVEPGDIDTFAEKLQYLIGNSDVRSSMGRAAAEHTFRNYSIAVVANKYMDLFNETLSTKKS